MVRDCDCVNYWCFNKHFMTANVRHFRNDVSNWMRSFTEVATRRFLPSNVNLCIVSSSPSVVMTMLGETSRTYQWRSQSVVIGMLRNLQLIFCKLLRVRLNTIKATYSESEVNVKNFTTPGFAIAICIHFGVVYNWLFHDHDYLFFITVC